MNRIQPAIEVLSVPRCPDWVMGRSDSRGAVLLNSTDGCTIKMDAAEAEEVLRSGFPVTGIASARVGRSDRLSPILCVTVELNTRCNFHCTYCYEDDLFTRDDIRSETIYQISDYVMKAIEEGGFLGVQLNFIGGEPLLSIARLLECYERVVAVCKVPVSVHIDTNGSRSFAAVAREIERLDLTVCLSLPTDNDTMRPYRGGRGSFKTIVKNIQELEARTGLDVRIGYNVHLQNAAEFPGFLGSIEGLRNVVSTIVSSRVLAYEHNPGFVSEMSEGEYRVWRRDVYYPAMSSAGWPVAVEVGQQTLCQGHQPYSCKVYANGRVGVCDAMLARDCLTSIDAIRDRPSTINSVYASIKSTDPYASCSDCGLSGVCEGRLYCSSKCEWSSMNIELAGIVATLAAAVLGR